MPSDEHQLAAVAVAERAEVEHRGGQPERVADGDQVERRSATRRTPCRCRAARRWRPRGSGWRPRRRGSASPARAARARAPCPRALRLAGRGRLARCGRPRPLLLPRRRHIRERRRRAARSPAAGRVPASRRVWRNWREWLADGRPSGARTQGGEQQQRYCRLPRTQHPRSVARRQTPRVFRQNPPSPAAPSAALSGSPLRGCGPRGVCTRFGCGP